MTACRRSFLPRSRKQPFDGLRTGSARRLLSGTRKGEPTGWQLVATVALAVSSAWHVAHSAESGLVVHFTFDAGSGPIVRDRSGNKNDAKIIGGAKWVKGDYGSALELNGTEAHVECTSNESLQSVAAKGTLEVWCYPYSVQGGLVNWSTGGGWNDERLVLAVDTYHGGNTVLGVLADGGGCQSFRGFGTVNEREWVHLAFTFDGEAINAYRDGVLNYSTQQTVKPDIEDVPLWIGRCLGLGKEYFHGLVDEVRVHNRVLSADELFASYKREAVRRGKDTSFFTKPRVEVAAYPGPGKIVTSVDVRAMQPLPGGIALTVDLCKPGDPEPLQSRRLTGAALTRPAEAMFDAATLEVGQYAVRSAVVGQDGERIGDVSEVNVVWNGQPAGMKGIKVLNNLVWELLKAKATTQAGLPKTHEFNNPYDRWVFLRTVAAVKKGSKLSILVDRQDTPAINYGDGSPDTLEAMQYLKAGRHTLNVRTKGDATLQSLTVRSIPALQHAFYGANPHIHAYGPYDWEFLKKDVLPNVNVMIGGPGPQLEQWKKSGRQWLAIIGLPPEKGDDEAAVESAYKHWSSSGGFQNPLMDGVIVDEFGGGDGPCYDGYRKAVERLYANPQFKDRMFLPYGGIFHGNDRSREFARAAIEGGGYVAWERYLREEPTENAARAALQSMADEMPRWEEALPGVTRRMVMVYGYMSQPTESLNVNPSVDYRVWMDMQVRTLATHPAFFGLGGIQEYHSSYCDEENVRLAGRLYRHYAIEGNTEPLIADPFRLPHLRNPDFDDGTTGWTITPAEEDSIQTKEHKGYSWLEGRYPPTPMGNTFLWTKRSATKPNAFSQEIKDLTPGRLYSMKMITADYQDLVQEKSRKATNTVTIKLDNVEILPGPKRSFQFTFPNCYAHIVGKFNAKYSFWMNYHWRVFRAKGTTARLTVHDWQTDTEPGGPIGQELMYNFIELQPYLGD